LTAKTDEPYSKMVYEGAEFKCILDTSVEHLKNIDEIILEFHCSYGNPEQLFKKLSSSGFNVSIIKSNTETGIIRGGSL